MPPIEDDTDLDLDLDNLGPGDPEGEADEQDEAEDPDEVAPDEGPDGKGRKGGEDEEGDEGRDVKPVGRGEKRIQALARELKERKERDEPRDRELAELKARVNAPSRPDPELEAQRLALMTPEERMQHQLDQGLQTNRQMLQRMEQMQRDQLDKVAYTAAATKDPRRAKLQDTVEKVYQEQLAAGRWVPRETVYFHELGKLVASQVAKKKPAAKKEGEDRVRRQTAPLGSGRGDVSPERGKGSKSFEDKYGDVPI
jgi:hypothetical protein